MNPITFLFGIHNHQPVGNFDGVIEEAYQKAYRPFLDVLDRHKGVKLALHNSGVLIDWFEARHPEYLDRLRKIVETGQIELLTGGYYEPILPSIPDDDKTGQIRKLTRKLKERLGGEVKGLWLTERVWEPSLVLPLKAAGVEYIMVDDSHFLAAGLNQESLWNYWLTEDQGETLAVWSISQKLRYLIPFEPAAKTIEYLGTLAQGGNDRVVLLADDGEKFGVWPDTFERVYAGGWLDEFFTLLEKNADWIRMSLPGEETRRRFPEGRIYLPTASYSEMMEWSLPTQAQLAFHEFTEKLSKNGASEARFARGGFWRNFLSKYPESNLMHKRMLEVRRHIFSHEGLPEPVRQSALDDVWQAQCNCAYWHGIFGGLYLPHLRDAVYRKILSAETRIDEARHGGEALIDVEEVDVDRDGRIDVRIKNRYVAALLAPARGGALEGLDFFPARRNFSHGMTRRHEAYHERLKSASPGSAGSAESKETSVRSIHERVDVKEEGLERRLFFDWYRRQSLIDHFFRPDTTMALFDQAEFGEQGDFVETPYEWRREPFPGGSRVVLSRSGHVRVNGRRVSVQLEKSVSLTREARSFQVDYKLRNETEETAVLWFGVEFNFSMLAGDAWDRYYLVDGKKPDHEPHLAGRGEETSVTEVSLRDDWERLAVTVQWTRPAQLWRLPVETVSLSESGFERVYQSSCVVPHWKFHLDPGQVWSLGFKVGVEALFLMELPNAARELGWLWLLSALTAADQTAAFQLMVGQPIVSGWLAGVIISEPALGLFMGICLQLLWSRVAPVGATAYPDVGPATVASVAVMSLILGGRAPLDSPMDVAFPGDGYAMALLAGLLTALFAGRVGQIMTVAERKGNVRLVEAADRASIEASYSGVERANLIGVFRAMGRGVILFPLTLAAFAGIAFLVRNRTGGLFPDNVAGLNPGVPLFFWFGMAAVLSVLWRSGGRNWLALLIGLAVGGLAERFW